MTRRILLIALKLLAWLSAIAVLAYTVYVVAFVLRYVGVPGFWSGPGSFAGSIHKSVAAWLNQFLALAAIVQTLLIALLWRFRVLSHWSGLILFCVFGAIALVASAFYLIYQNGVAQ